MLNFYDTVLHKLGNDKGDETIYINIGAMDGIMFDESVTYVNLYKYKCLYVEPISHAFAKLKENIKDTRSILENSAISDYDGIIQMITIDKEPIDRGLLHPCFYGMSAIYPPRNGLASGGDKEVVEKYGKFEIVPCITLETLFKKHNIEYFDAMSIDAEGHDWKILKQLDLQKYKPSIIRAEYINLSSTEKEEMCAFFSKNNYIFEIVGQNIDAIPFDLYKQLYRNSNDDAHNINHEYDKRVTIVTGLWNINRENLSEEFKRGYDHYRQKFIELLKTPVQMFIYLSEEDEEFVWKHRTKENTVVKRMESTEFETFFEFYDKVQSIRTNSDWYTQASWLQNSPQAKLKYYNPIVMSKMFLLNNVTLFNPFDSEYFYWIDAGITNTVDSGYFCHDKIFNNIVEYTEAIDSVLFLSYPYEDGIEIHGFPKENMIRYCETNHINYVCRGGFFGGKKEKINHINGLYYHMLSRTLSDNYMGTEESVFTILAHNHPDLIYKFELNGDGLIWPFFESLKDVKNAIKTISKSLTVLNAKNIIYILTFNSPEQFESVAKSIRNADPILFSNSRKILINNSTKIELFSEYDELCKVYDFEEIHKENLGVCGGRQFVAEHFDESDADFYVFFEDDMHLNSSDSLNVPCKLGFIKYVPNLYNTVIKIMIEEKFDFLKFSFSEFYGDNSVQWAWYNVPQDVRTEFWPHYDKLPESGLDKNAPKTQFSNIKTVDGISYITGEIYYSNWPQIVSKHGNKKMFLNTKWDYPFEQTWMSHMYQLTKIGEIKPAVLLASPVTHDRKHFYLTTERKEN